MKIPHYLTHINYFAVVGRGKGTYVGGGTWFEALGPNGSVVNAGIGQAVMFAGPLKHAGFPITSGIRNILVLFLYVEGFHYGPLLREYTSTHTHTAPHTHTLRHTLPHTLPHTLRHPLPLSSGQVRDTEIEGRDMDDVERTHPENDSTDDPRSSGAAKGGYVVYRQTVELVSMLEESEVLSE